MVGAPAPQLRHRRGADLRRAADGRGLDRARRTDHRLRRAGRARLRRGRAVHAAPGRDIEENFWRAIRFGLDGKLIDFDARAEYPAAAAADRLLEWTAPVRAELGIEPQLAERNVTQRLRDQLAAGQDLQASVFAATR